MEPTADLKEQKRLARNAANRAWKQANPDKVKAYQDKYNKTHPDKVKASRDKYNKAHVEQIRARNREANAKQFAESAAKQKAIQEAWETSETPAPSWLTKPPMVVK